MLRRLLLVVPVLSLLAACGDDPAEQPDAGPGPALVFTTPPVTGLPEGTRFAGSVPYGTDPEQVVDVFLPASGTPTAAVLYIHGGGFTGGTRTDAYGGQARALHQVLDAGVAWIGVEYRLLDPIGTETEGVNKSLHDSKRALQFVRYHAATFNIDPQRIGLHGGSAGAGTSLWLAFHDDMAVAGSTDPIERMSTRPQAVGVLATQSTYDVYRWAPDVFHDTYEFVSNDILLTQAPLRGLLVQFYGLDASLVDDAEGLKAAIEASDMAAYRADIDMLALMSSDDPPVYFRNDAPNLGPLEDGFDLLHHPLHAQALLARAAEASATAEADIPAFEVMSDDEAIEFLLEHLEP